jgi:RHS repeat-associated protein
MNVLLPNWMRRSQVVGVIAALLVVGALGLLLGARDAVLAAPGGESTPTMTTTPTPVATRTSASGSTTAVTSPGTRRATPTVISSLPQIGIDPSDAAARRWITPVPATTGTPAGSTATATPGRRRGPHPLGSSDPIVGDWLVTYGAPAVVTMSLSGGVYTITAKTAVLLSGGSCWLPAGTVMGSFSLVSGDSYSGSHNLWYVYTCLLAGSTSMDLTLSNNVLSGPLGGGSFGTITFDRNLPPTAVPPGMQYCSPCLDSDSAGDPVSSLTGSYAYQHVDIAIPGLGPSPSYARAYNSADTRVTRLGPGWTDNYSVRVNDPGDGSCNIILVGPQGRSDTYTSSASYPCTGPLTYAPPPAVYTQLVKNADDSYTATLPDQTVWSFNTAGQLAAITDRYGNTSVLSYNANSQLIAVSDPAGRGGTTTINSTVVNVGLTFGYTSTVGLLTSITDWQSGTPREVQFGYDGYGRLTSVTDRNSQTTQYAYSDPTGVTALLTTITDANGHVAITNHYDGANRVDWQADAAGIAASPTVVTSFAYVTATATGTAVTTISYPATSYDSATPQTLDTYDSSGRLTQRKLIPSNATPEIETLAYSYDSNSDVSTATDGRGNTTTYCYDVPYTGGTVTPTAGNVTRKIQPVPTGTATGTATPLVTLYEYDSKNNLIETIPPQGVNAPYNVDCTTNLASSINTTYATDLLYDLSGVTLRSVTRYFTDPTLGFETAITQYEYGDSTNKGRVTTSIPPRGNVGAAMTPLAGATSVATAVATPTPGRALLYQVTASASGTANQIELYLDGGNAASPIDVGLYADASNSPATLLAQGVLTAPQTSAWNDVPISEVTLASGTKYWIAVLGPYGGGTPAFRQTSSGTALRGGTNLTALPAPSWSGASTSFSGTLSADIVGPDYTYATTFVYATPNASPTATPVAASGMLVSTTDPLGNKTTYAYDPVGRRLSMVDPNGYASASATPADHTWSTTYDNEDRPLQVAAPSPTAGATALVTTYEYDPVGNRSVVIDANRQITTYEYDVRDSLAEVDQSPATWTPVGTSTATPVTTPTPLIKTTYSYDSLGNLITVLRDAGGSAPSTVGYTYDGLNRVRTEKQYPNGPTATPTLLTSYAYDLANNRTQLTDPLGQTTSYTYDNLNRPTGVSYTGTVTPVAVSYTYDADGNRLTMGDGTGTTTYSYDEQDRLLSVMHTGLSSVAYRYDRDGNRRAITYAGGKTVSYTFDKDDRLIGLADWASPTPRAMSYSYLPDGSLETITNVDGSTGNFSYDNALRLTEVSNALGSSIIDQHGYVLDGVGNRTKLNEILASPGAAMPGTWGLNSSGQLGAATSGSCGGSACSARPLPVGTGVANGVSGVIAVAGGQSHSVALTGDGHVWTWGLNSSGQLGDGTTTNRTAPVEVIDATPVGTVTAVALSNITAIAVEQNTTFALDSSGNVWAWGSNADGNLGQGTSDSSAHSVAVQVPTVTSVIALAAGEQHALALKSDGSTLWAWGSNSNGQIGNNSSGSNVTSPTTVSGLSGTPLLAIAGGGTHSLALISNSGTQTLLAWGGNGNGQLGDGSTTDRLTPVAVSGLSNVNGIAGGHLHSLAVKTDGSVWAWGSNTLGQLGDGTTTQRATPIAVQGVGGSGTLGNVTSVAASGNHSTGLGGDGSVYGWGANSDGQVGDDTTTGRSHVVYVVGPGGTGQLAGMTAIGAGASHTLAVEGAHSVVTNYTYDHLYRLLTGGSPGQPTTYTYDTRGNRTSLTAGTTTTAYSYDSADRITGIGTATPTVDADGELTATGSGVTFGYDVANRLVSVSRTGTPTASYAYDGDGKRASKTVSGTTTTYVYDVNGSLPNVLTDGTVTYVYGLGLAYTVDGSNNVQVMHTDGLGSVRALTDGSGNVTQTFASDEFGNPTLTQGSSTEPFRYTGQQQDAETGFYDLRARYYAPTIGRFLTRDRVFGATTGPVSLNRYIYARNNSSSAVDPSGLCSAWSGAGIEEMEGEGPSLGCAGEIGSPASQSDAPPSSVDSARPMGSQAINNSNGDTYQNLNSGPLQRLVNFFKSLVTDESGGAPRYSLPSDAIRVSGRFPDMAGPNETLYRVDPKTGDLTYYEVYDAAGLPVKRVDLVGPAHAGIPTPHVQEYDRNVAPDGTVYVNSGVVRPALPEEIP